MSKELRLYDYIVMRRQGIQRTGNPMMRDLLHDLCRDPRLGSKSAQDILRSVVPHDCHNIQEAVRVLARHYVNYCSFKGYTHENVSFKKEKSLTPNPSPKGSLTPSPSPKGEGSG